jgi:hypothetical protein
MQELMDRPQRGFTHFPGVFDRSAAMAVKNEIVEAPRAEAADPPKPKKVAAKKAAAPAEEAVPGRKPLKLGKMKH